MNRIEFTSEFERKVKSLVKKYRSLKGSIDKLGADLVENPFLGESYGANIYKVRLADKSKGTGKRGGFRVLYYLAFYKNDNIDILLMTIFDKSEIDTIQKKDAEMLLRKILNEDR